MTKAIQQSVRFEASPKQLFEMYMDSRKHSEATGGKARIERRVGGKFSAWNGALRGRNLMIVPNKMLVQAWRSVHFEASDPDSILILQFRKAGSGCVVELVHANVAAQDHQGVRGGWPKYCWRPWKKYLARKKR